MLELTMLTVPDCPNEAVLRERLVHALTDHPEAQITTHVIDNQADAARWGMHGSPTLLINGVDVFAAPNTPASVSCRLYRDESGPTGGAPSVVALREALRHAVDTPIPAALAQAAGRAGLGRVAPVEGGLRAVHQRVLRAFVETGQPPAQKDLDQAAAPYGSSGSEVMAQLHAADFLRLDHSGVIVAAYPFSPTPTLHRVQISGGPEVYSMCAIDALGIAAMIGRDVTIHATEPGTGQAITVTVSAQGDQVEWKPGSAVVFYGQQEDAACCETCPPESSADTSVPSVAADVCCGYINFFTDAAAAQAWSTSHPQVAGQMLAQRQAWEIGVHIFGPLLRPFD
ncbi:alkylmercury lyase family protein [Nonomuraea ceibae]|uniref:alkylmercury lyase family protein n=1 Tax=Nonomuraea ceibae TaxID=1935170 RepID=UPI001C5EA84F|nr:alkylmercury lyase family protein [Nonomuraea ceibae]